MEPKATEERTGIPWSASSKHPYNLPLRVPMRTAAVLTVAVVLAPTNPGMPIAQIVCAGIIAFFWIESPRQNQLGMSLPISKRSKRVLIIVVAGMIAFLLLSILTAGSTREDMIEHPFGNLPTPKQLPYDFLGEWAPDPAIHQGLTQKDSAEVLKFLVKPIIGTIVLAPINETIIMFGLLFPAVWRQYGYFRGLLGVPFIFALVHVFQTGPFAFILIFISGFLQAYLYARTKSIYPSIVLHACWNLFILASVTIINWGFPYA